MAESVEKQGYFPALTGVRAIAAFMVYLHHFNPFEDYSKKLTGFFDEFHVGVTFFFVLSGFLIAYRYYGHKIQYRQYIVNRFARIYPMYFLVTLLCFVFHHIDRQSIIILLANISFLRGFFDPIKFSMVAQGWSLTVEETFYFLAPVFFYLILKRRINIMIIPVILILFGVGQVIIFQKWPFYGFMNGFEFLFNYTFWGRCIEFFTGILLAIQFKENKTMYSKIPYKTYTGFFSILFCIFLIDAVKMIFHVDFGVRHPIGIIINTLILPVFGIGLFYNGILTEINFITRVLSSRTFILLGKSSYIFYLIHLGMFQTIVYKSITWFEWPTIIEYPIVFILLNIIAIMMYTFLEEPINRYLRRVLSAKKIRSQEIRL